MPVPSERIEKTVRLTGGRFAELFLRARQRLLAYEGVEEVPNLADASQVGYFLGDNELATFHVGWQGISVTVTVPVPMLPSLEADHALWEHPLVNYQTSERQSLGEIIRTAPESGGALWAGFVAQGEEDLAVLMNLVDRKATYLRQGG